MKLKLSILLFVLLVFCSAKERGWAGAEPGAGPTPQRPEERIRRVEDGLIPLDQNRQLRQPATLAERMRFYKVPGVSVAVINRGELEWARGYGVVETGTAKPVTAEPPRLNLTFSEYGVVRACAVP